MKLKKSFLASFRLPKQGCLCGVLVFMSAFLFFSCVSKPVPIPGDADLTKKDLHKQYYELGNEYYSLKNYDKALVFYKYAMENKSMYSAALYKCSLVYIQKSDWKNAEISFQNLLKKNAANDSLKASLAYVYAMQGEYESAEEIYTALIEKQPDNSEYLENLIAIKLSQNDAATSEELLKSLKEKFPDSKNIKKFTDALEDLKNKETEKK